MTSTLQQIERTDSAPPPKSRRASLARLYLSWSPWLCVALGVALRTREYLYDKSLWDDEIAVASNIIGRGFLGLTRPLTNQQGAPVGWLWAERVSIDVFGVSELSLRLIPFIGSLVALGVFPIVARRLVGSWSTPVATFLVATSPALIYYGAETKQYSSDTAAALLLLLASTELWRRTDLHREAAVTRPAEAANGWWHARWWGLGWGLVAAVLAWSSQPTILVAAACGIVLVIGCWRNRGRSGAVLIGGVVLGGSLAAEWAISLSALSQNDKLSAYWQGAQAYPPKAGGAGPALHWVWHSANDIVGNLGHLTPTRVGVVLAVIGLAAIAVRRPVAAALFALIGAVAFGAALTRHFPLVGTDQPTSRLSLYLAPIAIMLLAAPIEAGRLLLKRRRRLAGIVVATVATVLVLVLTASGGWLVGLSKFASPDETTAGRQAVAFVADHQQQGDMVLLGRYASGTVGFYAPRLGVSVGGRATIAPAKNNACPADPFGALALTGPSRVWLILAHHATWEPANRTQLYLDGFTQHGRLLASFHGAGDAGAYLFQIEPPTPRSGTAAPASGYCLTVARLGS